MAHLPVGAFHETLFEVGVLLVLVWLFPACSRQKTAPESSREKPSNPFPWRCSIWPPI